MSKSKQLVPELRFPEFVGTEVWKEQFLRNVFSIFQGYAFSSQSSSKTGVRWLKIADVGIQKMDASAPSYLPVDYKCKYKNFLVKQGDYVIALTRPILNKKLKIAKVDIMYSGALLNQRVGKLVTNQNVDFINYQLQTFQLVNEIERNIAGNDPPNLSPQKIGDIIALIPSIEEQAKIAACLSSLDELISAHTEKLEALKIHKKGLMQQLFPKEGETVPKLRFPEFHNQGEWESKKVSDLLLQSFYGTSKSTSSDIGQYPVLRMGNMYDGKIDISNLVYIDLDENEFSKLQLKKDDILLNRTNSFDLVGKVSIFNLDMKCVVASYIVVYRFDNSQIIPQFCNFLLNTYLYQEKIKMLSTKAVNQANINPTTFKESIFISYPSLKEQQKIAACLTSIDERITAQSQKIAALKTHKKVLMQQLFPAVDETTII